MGRSKRRRLIPRSVERDDFAVGGEAAEADQHADQHGHRDGEGQDGRQRAEKKQRNGANAAGVADDQVHQPDELWHEENESEDSKAKDGVGGDFAADISSSRRMIARRHSSMARPERARRVPFTVRNVQRVRRAAGQESQRTLRKQEKSFGRLNEDARPQDDDEHRVARTSNMPAVTEDNELSRVNLVILWHMHQPQYRDPYRPLLAAVDAAARAEGLLGHGEGARRISRSARDVQFRSAAGGANRRVCQRQIPRAMVRDGVRARRLTAAGTETGNPGARIPGEREFPAALAAFRRTAVRKCDPPEPRRASRISDVQTGATCKYFLSSRGWTRSIWQRIRL